MIALVWTGNIEYKPVMKLDNDFAKAMKKLETLEQINSELPGLDCGACGTPSCRALAEDIVRGNANETDCIFKLREKVRNLAVQMMELEAKMPPVMDKSLDSQGSQGYVKMKVKEFAEKLGMKLFTGLEGPDRGVYRGICLRLAELGDVSC